MNVELKNRIMIDKNKVVKVSRSAYYTYYNTVLGIGTIVTLTSFLFFAEYHTPLGVLLIIAGVMIITIGLLFESAIDKIIYKIEEKKLEKKIKRQK